MYALPGALIVLALDPSGMLDDAYVLYEFVDGHTFEIGPFGVGYGFAVALRTERR